MKDEKDIYSNNGDMDNEELSSEDIFSRLNESSEMEDADEDLLALLDMISAQDEKQKSNVKSNNESAEQKPDSSIFSIDDFSLDNGEDNNEMHENDLVSDSFAPDKIVNADFDKSSGKAKSLDNMGDVFSDALSAMDTLEDEELVPGTEGTAVKKLGFFQRLFARRKKKDKSAKKAAKTEKPEKAEKLKQAEKAEKQEKAAAKKAKEKDDKKKAAREEAKKAKTSKENTARKAPEAEVLTEEEKAKRAKAKEEKAKKAAEKAEKKKAAAAKKAEKSKAAADKAAEKKRIKQEKKENTPPDPEDSVKLNTLGVVFIMTFFILLAGIVIIGTDTYSYNLDVKNASVNYSRGRYTEAYYDIYGLNIKKKDEKIYDRIMTTMYVNKQLNSYDNYIEMKKYPEALDSLLKGLERYDIHIAHAKELGIEKNLNSLKKKILKELKDTYGLTEKQARAINAIDDQTKYSVKVINIASEKE